MCIVEFQRYSGDALAFDLVYGRAMSYLGDVLRSLVDPCMEACHGKTHGSNTELAGDFNHAELDGAVNDVSLHRCDGSDCGRNGEKLECIGFDITDAFDAPTPLVSYHPREYARPDARFQATDAAPALSPAAAVCLEVTTLRLSHASPCEFGNRLLDFLRIVVSGRIRKVSLNRFSIKAEAVLDGLLCEIAIRMYQQEHTCVIEFQKYSGDSLAFNTLYRLAANYLRCS